MKKVGLGILLALSTLSARGQTLSGDPLPTVPDTAISRESDSLSVNSLTDSVQYKASRVSYDVRSKIIILSGDATITYQGMTLSADTIQFRTGEDLVVAYGGVVPGIEDSVRNPPTFVDPTQSVKGLRITYNLKTKRGLVKDAKSSHLGTIYSGESIKRTGFEQLDVDQGQYTTCEEDDPHYRIESNRMRLVVGDKIIAKPVVMKIADIPVAWFPFAVFFVNNDRRSGFLTPRLGENARNGRYMRNMGYYMAPNDYLGAEARISIDERIGWDFSLRTAYRDRYRLNGSVSGLYRRIWPGSILSEQRFWQIRFDHRQEIDPFTRLTARGLFTNTERLDNITGSSEDRLTRNLNSRATISRSWPESRRNATLGLSHDLDLRTDGLTQTLPQFSISQGNTPLIAPPESLGPRARQGSVAPLKWYHTPVWRWGASLTNTRVREPSVRTIIDVWVFEQQFADSTETYELTLRRVSSSATQGIDGGFSIIRVEDVVDIAQGWWIEEGDGSLSLYSLDLTESLGSIRQTGANSNSLEISLAGTGVFDDGEKLWHRKPVPDGMTQRTRLSFSTSAPQKVGKWLTVTPQASWSQDWKSEDLIDPLNRATSRDNINLGLATSATFFGTFPLELGPLQAIRHVVSPSVSYSYRVRSESVGGVLGYGGIRSTDDPARIVNLSLNNQFDARFKWKEQVHTLNRLVNVRLTTNYNLDPVAPQKRKLGNLSTSIQVKPDKRFDTQINLTHDFHDKSGARLPLFSPRLTRARISTSLRLAGEFSALSTPGEESLGDPGIDRLDPLDDGPGTLMQAMPGKKVGAPWQLTLRHTYSWTDRGGTSANQITLTAGGSPAPDWRVDYQAHYDIEQKKLVNHTITFKRQMHCWQASLNWEPRGFNKGFYFIIQVIDIPDIKVETASENRRVRQY